MSELTAQNPRSIQRMFGAISKNYDLANSVLSFGIHHLWKRKLIRTSQAQPGHRVLDCATGTGDLAFRFEKAVSPGGTVIGSDFCEPMLEVARTKALRTQSNVTFEKADVTQLPYSNQNFDIASISFGIRNVPDPQKALSELGRIVRSGGRVLVLEFGQPHFWPMRILFGLYSLHLLPRIGGWLSGERQAYQYLQTSSAQFPCQDAFLELAKKTGKYSAMRTHSLLGGIAYLYDLKVR